MPLAFSLTGSIALLSRTPGVLDAWLRDLPDEWTDARETADTWSPFDIVGHLIQGEKTDWMPRARVILRDGDHRPFERFNRFAQFDTSRGRRLPELLDEFARLRKLNIDELQTLRLTESDLERRGRHPDLGPVRLRQLLATWVAHDLDHLMQIARVLGTQYAEEVGPWRAYLRVVSGEPG